jgi:hypothetical protein
VIVCYNVATESPIQSDTLALRNLITEADIKDLNEWSSVSVDQVKKHGGSDLLRLYQGSWTSALQSLYPECTWNATSRKELRDYWKDINNQRAFLDNIRAELSIFLCI